MFLENRLPYQYGDPRNGDFIVFNCDDLALQYQPRVKTERASSSLLDGDIRLNVNEKNKLDNTIIKLKFSLNQSEKYTQNYILSLFSEKPRKFFVYEEGEEKNQPIKRILWQYAEAITLPQVFSGTNERGFEYKVYEVELYLLKPYFYDVDLSLYYFQDGAVYPVANGAYQANGAITAGEYMNQSFVPITTPQQQQQAIFGGKILSVIDQYYAIEDINIMAASSLFNTTLTSNNPLYVESNNINLQTSKETDKYLIQFNPLNTNEWIEIENLDTGGSVRITWLDQTPHVYNMIYSSVYNVLISTGTREIILTSQYRIDNPTGNPLFFSNKLKRDLINKFIYVNKTTDSLRIQKNTSSNNTIYIQTLKSFI